MRLIARVVTIALAASLLSADVSAGAAASAVAQASPKPDPRLTVQGRPVTPEPRWAAATDHSDPQWLAPPPVVAPRAGVADVVVPVSGLARAGDLPVFVGRPMSGAAPSKVTVTVHGPEAAAAAGASFVLLSVARADGARVPGRVRLAIDYSGFRYAYGADFASRLRLVSLPSCTESTPTVTGCSASEFLPANNDLELGRLSAEVVVPPALSADNGLGRVAPEVPAAVPSTDAALRDAASTEGEAVTASQTEPTAVPEPEVSPEPTAEPSVEPSPEPSGEKPASGEGEVAPMPDLPAGDSGGTYAVASTPAGPTGDFKATPLSTATKWSVSKNTGGFSWSYPFPMPPAPAGATPSLELAYSSQSVDGRTAKANGQVSQVGEGFSLSPMFIERKFQSCTEDLQTAQDLCHQNPEYFLSWNGRSSELVRKPNTNEWRLRDDPGWRVRSLQGASNGDKFGDYWEVTTPDGARHLFGYGKEPTTSADTWGAWTVPVFGDDPGEPCYSATGGFGGSSCWRAWRWNLDRIVDTNDNVVSLFWSKETNYYARNGGTPALYDRGGYLRRIDYGERNTREQWAAPAFVTISTTHRCAAQVGCTDDTLNTPGNYPDVPLDLRCTSSTSCPGIGQKAPSFWSTEKIVKVNTWVKNNDATDGSAIYSDVDEVELFYTFPDTGEATTESLFLTTIRRHGLVGTRITLPDVHLGGTRLSNRVDFDAAGGVPATNKYRLGSIEDQLGATTTVTYGQENPCSANALPPNGGWHQNDTDCFPQYYDPDGAGGTPAGWGAFRKYLVKAVEIDDTTVPLPHSPNQQVSYTYLGTPAWHYDNQLQGSEGPTGNQSWSDFRGYESVREVRGDPASSSRATTVYKAFRGMHGDKAGPLGGTKSVSITDYAGTAYTDSDWLSGRPLETIRYSVAGSALERVLHEHWAQRQFAGPAAWQPHDVYFVRDRATDTYTRNTLSSAETWRRRRSVTGFDPTYAVAVETHNMGDTAVLTDDTCTEPTYAHNTTAWIIGRPGAVRRYSGNCLSQTQISRTEIAYDGQTFNAAPTKGNPTTIKSLVDGVAAAITTTTYDLLGRVASVTAPNEYAKAATSQAKTTYTYNPASGYPRLGVTERRGVVNGNGGMLSTTTVPDLAWGGPRVITDNFNNATTTITRDALGRIATVHRPEDPVGVPGLVYEYHLSQDLPSRVRERRLLEGTTSGNAVYVDTFNYVTAFGTPAQTQTAAPGGGRIVTGSRYDDQGRAVGAAGPMQASDFPGANFVHYDPATAPSDTRTTYDALGRATATRLYGTNVLKATTTYDHGGWSTIAHPPVRDQITTFFDVFGRTTQINETAAATDGYSTTNYEYAPSGQLAEITDDNDNTWTYTYDWLGRRTHSDDPDQGTWITTYDANGNVTKVQDAIVENGVSHAVWHGYDTLNRRTETRQTGPTGTLLASWAYGATTAGAGFVGRLVSTTSRSGGSDYTYRITGYDRRGRVTSKQWEIPDTEGWLSGTFPYSYTYDHADNLRTTSLPDSGGLGAETLTAGFDPRGYPTTLTGTVGAMTTTYIKDTIYDGVGRLLQRRLGDTGITVRRDVGHDPATGRLTSATATVVSPTGEAVADALTFTYDEAGNVTRVGALQPDVGGVTQYECFGYNWRNQLDRAFTTTTSTCQAPDSNGASPYDYTYAYDTTSNLKSVVGSDATGAVNRKYGYPTAGEHSVQPHALNTVNAADKFDYDANGAATKRYDADGVEQTLTWNWLHQLERVRTGTSNDTTFVYAADGSRLLRLDPDGTRTLFLEGQEIVNTTGSIYTTGTRFYGNAALRTTAGSTAGLHWLVGNHQGSNTATVAADGTVSRRRYGPFGAARPAANAVLPTTRGFLNKVEDPTGLVATDARYLDATAGRFVSADPLINVSDARSLNPYLYAYGNPTSSTDASGLAPACDEGYENCAQRQDAFENNLRKVNDRVPPEPLGPPMPPVYGFELPHVIGPQPHTVIRDPANWCLVSRPVGTTGPCGAPPREGIFTDAQAKAIVGWFTAAYGAGVAAHEQNAIWVRRVSATRVMLRVVKYNRGIDDLKKFLSEAPPGVVRGKWVGRAFIVADAGMAFWSDWRETGGQSTLYRVGHASAETAGAVVGGLYGASKGASLGASLCVGGPLACGVGTGVGALGGALVGQWFGEWAAGNFYEELTHEYN